MFSSQRFPLAAAHVFDLGDFDAAALLFLAAWTAEFKSQDIPAMVRKDFSISFTFFSPQSVHSLLAFICLCLSGQWKFVVSAICSLLVLSLLLLFFLFFLFCRPESKLPTLERVRACLSHDPRVAHCSSLQSKTSTSIMTAHYLPCSHIKIYIYTTEDITSLLIYITIMAVLEPCRKLRIRPVAKMAWMTDGLGN